MAFNQTVTNSRQIPNDAILQAYGKQTYLGNAYSVVIPTVTISSANVETGILSLFNPTASAAQPTNIVQPSTAFINYKKLVCLTASATAQFNVYFNPTGLSTSTSPNMYNLRASSTNTPVIEGGNGTITTSTNGLLMETLASTAFTPDTSSVLMALDPNTILYITAIVSANSTKVGGEVTWYEL